MKTLKLWAVQYNSDQTEGRGHNVTLAYFEHFIDAETCKRLPYVHRSYGIMGTPAGIEVVPFEIKIYESMEDYGERGKEILHSIRRKLTPEELKWLEIE